MKRSCFPHRTMARPHPDQTNIHRAVDAFASNVQIFFADPFACPEPAHFRSYKRLLPWFCLAKGSTYHFKLDHNVLPSDSGLVSGLPQVCRSLASPIGPKDVADLCFHLYSLSSMSHNILWATVTKICHTWHKISFHDGTTSGNAAVCSDKL